MSMTLRAEPVGQWVVPQTPAGQRIRGAAIDWRYTMETLQTLVGDLGGSEVVLGLDVTEEQIAANGVPTGDVGAFPGVRVSFECRHGPLAFHCDRYDEWQVNVFEVATLLEVLAEADNCGAGGRQYHGWRVYTPLVAAPQPPAETAMADAAARLAFLAEMHGPAVEVVAELLDSPARMRRAVLIAEARDLTAEQRAELIDVRRVLGIT